MLLVISPLPIMTRRFDEWLEVSEIEPSHKFRWRTHYRKCPRRGQSEEEDAVKDAPSVGAAAMATEDLVVLKGVGSHSGSHSNSELNAAFGCSQIQTLAQRR